MKIVLTKYKVYLFVCLAVAGGIFGAAKITRAQVDYDTCMLENNYSADADAKCCQTYPVSCPTAKTTAPPPANGKVTATLKFGSKGPDVGILQQALKTAVDPSLVVDNDFKIKTQAAVETFQAMNQLAVTGIADVETLTKLGIYGGSAAGNTPPANTPPTNPTSPTTNNPPNGSSALKCDPPLVNQGGICVPVSPFTGGFAGSAKLLDLIFAVIGYLLLLAGVIAVGMLVIGGFFWMTAAGNEEQAEKGKKTLTNAIIGLVVVIMAYAIVKVITSTLTGAPAASDTTATTNTTTKRSGVNMDGSKVQ